MATHYGGIGDTSMNNSEPQDMDADIQDNYQADINDLENIEPDQSGRIKGLNSQNRTIMANVEANDNDPMDTISQLEWKLTQLALTLLKRKHPLKAHYYKISQY